MANRKALISLMALLLAMLGGWGLAMFSAEAPAGPVAAHAQSQPAPAIRANVIFEYKILNLSVGEAFALVSGSYDNKAQPTTVPVRFIEHEINRLATEGYVVESLQKETSVFSAGSGIDIVNPVFVVLLKREKK